MRYLVFVAVLACAAAVAAAERFEPAAYLQSDVGRYQLVQLGQSRADQFLLDTKTGRIWRGICAPGSTDSLKCSIVWKHEDVQP